MNQRRDRPDRGHERAPFNSAELMPPPTRTESFWEPFQKLYDSLKQQNGPGKPPYTRKTSRAGTPVAALRAVLAFHVIGAFSTHLLAQVWQQSRLPKGKPSPFTFVPIADTERSRNSLCVKHCAHLRHKCQAQAATDTRRRDACQSC